MKDTKCTKCLGLLPLTLTLLYLKSRVWKLCSFVNTPVFLLGTKMPAVSDVTDSPGSDQTLLISASCKAPRGRIPHSLPLLLPQLSKQTGAGWECLLGSGNQSSYLVLKLPAALPGPSLLSDFPVLDSGQERADPALKVGAPWCGCGPGVSEPSARLRTALSARTWGRRPPCLRRQQQGGASSRVARSLPDAEPARRTVRGPAAVSDSRRRSALLRSPATSREKESCPCHLAQASACPRLGDPMRQAPRDRRLRAAESGEPRPWSPAHVSAVIAPGPRRVTLCGWPRCGFA